jgi:hypothetical protein
MEYVSSSDMDRVCVAVKRGSGFFPVCNAIQPKEDYEAIAIIDN